MNLPTVVWEKRRGGRSDIARGELSRYDRNMWAICNDRNFIIYSSLK